MMLVALVALAPIAPPAPQELRSLAIVPDAIHLEGARDHERVLALATDEQGFLHDVSERASWQLADAGLAQRDGPLFTGVRDGETTLTVELDGMQASIPILVSHAGERRALSFRGDVLPVLTASGCNQGSCHGKASGQDGFRLSLFGFDPEGDWWRIAREIPGRRVDLAFPEQSLVVEKGLGAVPHTGGQRFPRESAAFETLREWIASGAPHDPLELARVVGIELYPHELLCVEDGESLPLLVRALYSDGTDRDVTDLAVLRTSNEVSARLEKGNGARVQPARPGEAFLTARFDVLTVGSPVIVIAKDAPAEWVDPAKGILPASEIDLAVEKKLRKLRVLPTPLCDDTTFLRRAWIDLVGLLPPEEEARTFASDPDPDKRAQLVERLLQRKEFVDLWVMEWAELLQIRSSQAISQKAAQLYFDWLSQTIAGGVPVDRMVREILCATGGTFTSPATNFFQNQRDNLVLAENVAQAFLGVRVQCAQCHNHPFDRWTQDDYYGFAAFFAQVGRKQAEDPRETIVFDQRGGEVQHPVGGRVVAPKFLGGAVPDVAGRDRRLVLAEWLTAPDNPFFARALANRVWAHFLGVGIVEPVDDLRVSNPPSNGELLDVLAARFVGSGFDLRDLVRAICSSRAYQRSSEPDASNERDLRNFARAQVRRLRAETLLDVIAQVTEIPEKLGGLPLGARAVEIADGGTSSYFLDTFGRSPRETVCACEVSFAPSLSQVLHLLNGTTLASRVRASPLVQRSSQEELPLRGAIETLTWRFYSRAPSPEEVDRWLGSFVEGTSRASFVEDLVWAMLNSREFLFWH
jgi:hypothetical protein